MWARAGSTERNNTKKKKRAQTMSRSDQCWVCVLCCVDVCMCVLGYNFMKKKEEGTRSTTTVYTQ